MMKDLSIADEQRSRAKISSRFLRMVLMPSIEGRSYLFMSLHSR
jgi:hypothetical protein